MSVHAIRTDQMQVREELDANVIREYGELYEAGSEFPPIVLFDDPSIGSDYWLADGHHRHAAASYADHTFINAKVYPGTKRDAILYALGANAKHGLQRTDQDKRNAVQMMLGDPEWSKWSNREIARQCQVSDVLVGKLRKKLTANACSDNPDSDSKTVTYTDKHGNQSTMNVSSIGRRADVEPETGGDDQAEEALPSRKYTDKLGNEITRLEVSQAFDIIPKLKTMMAKIDEVRKTLKLIDGEPGVAHLHTQHAESSLKNAKAEFAHAMPYAITPTAVAEKNPKWGKIGFLTKRQYDLVPEEDRD